MRRTWTDKEVSILKKKYATSSNQDLQELITLHNKCSIKTKAAKLKLKKEKRGLSNISEFWKKNENKLRKLVAKGHTNQEVADILKCSKASVSNRKFKLGIKSLANNGKFKKGSIPFNKGKKWDDFMSKEGQANSRKSTFKKGNIPANHRPVGSTRKDTEGYWYIKTEEPNVWELLHRVIYIQHHSDYVPKKDEVIEFIDGNKDNVYYDNLRLNTRQNSMLRASSSNEGIVRHITRDKDIQAFILAHYPQLIETKRKSIKLKKSLKNLQDDSSRKEP